jgi:hypothetical protein
LDNVLPKYLVPEFLEVLQLISKETEKGAGSFSVHLWFSASWKMYVNGERGEGSERERMREMIVFHLLSQWILKPTPHLSTCGFAI